MCGNILTELKMQACCRKIHVLNGASADRYNVPVEKRHFLISIPKQFAQRMGLQKGDSIFFMIDKTREGIAYILSRKAMSCIDTFVKQTYSKFWDGRSEQYERNLQCKSIDPQQFSFYIAHECMQKLGWPTSKGTQIHMVIMDEMILRVALMK